MHIEVCMTKMNTNITENCHISMSVSVKYCNAKSAVLKTVTMNTQDF